MARNVSSPPLATCPPIFWFDDEAKLRHHLGKSIKTLERMQKDEGLTIHRHPSRGRYVLTSEFLAHLAAMEALPRLTSATQFERKEVPLAGDATSSR